MERKECIISLRYILELIELLKKNLDIIYIECYKNIIKI